jgi:hypothetical protein
MTINVYEISKVYDVVQYLHAVAFFPVPSSFIKAIEAGDFTTRSTLMAQHAKKVPQEIRDNNKRAYAPNKKKYWEHSTKTKKTTAEEQPEYEPHTTKEPMSCRGHSMR